MAETAKGLAELIARIQQMQARGRDLLKPLKATGVYMLGSIERNFRAQGRPQRWQGLAKSTLRRRRRGKGKGSPQILIDNSILKGSIAPHYTDSSVEIGSNLIYARRHQLGYEGGGGRGRSRTPARPYLLFQDEDVPVIGTFFLRHLTV